MSDRDQRAVGEVQARRDGDHDQTERQPVGVVDGLVHRGEHAEQASGEEELGVAFRVLRRPFLPRGDRVHDRVVGVAVEERDHGGVARVVRQEAFQRVALAALRELVEHLGDVLLLVGHEAPLGLALVEEPLQLLHDVDDGDRRAGALDAFHVVGELLELRQRTDVLHAVGLSRVGDDDELARPEELLVQLRVGDVVRVVGEEQCGARGHVADLQPPAPDRADEDERDREDRASPALPAGARRDGRARDAVVDRVLEQVEGEADPEHHREAGGPEQVERDPPDVEREDDRADDERDPAEPLRPRRVLGVVDARAG